MKITPKLRSAIRRTKSENKWTWRDFGDAVGVHNSLIHQWQSGHVDEIYQDNWKRLAPVIGWDPETELYSSEARRVADIIDYLPDEHVIEILMCAEEQVMSFFRQENSRRARPRRHRLEAPPLQQLNEPSDSSPA